MNEGLQALYSPGATNLSVSGPREPPPRPSPRHKLWQRKEGVCVCACARACAWVGGGSRGTGTEEQRSRRGVSTPRGCGILSEQWESASQTASSAPGKMVPSPPCRPPRTYSRLDGCFAGPTPQIGDQSQPSEEACVWLEGLLGEGGWK